MYVRILRRRAPYLTTADADPIVIRRRISRRGLRRPDRFIGSPLAAPAARVRFFTCSSAERRQVERVAGRSVTEAELKTAVQAAAERAVEWTSKAAQALQQSPRVERTRQLFFEAFATNPETVPGWRPAGASWNDLGGLIAIRLSRAAKIIEGGWIKYFCWGSQAHCPECTRNPTRYIACSSFRGRYLICLGEHFWKMWRDGNTVGMASNFLHEALHIYFGRTVGHSGSIGNASCYQRFVHRFNNLPLEPFRAQRCPPNLRLGSRGADVRELQLRLNIWIRTAGVRRRRLRADGVFGAKTEATAKAFQSSQRLTDDGVVGPQSWAGLPVLPVLRRGSRNETVRELQRRLNTWITISPGVRLRALVRDAVFGAKTEAAVKAFQRDRHRTDNGVVGRTTWNRLPAD